MNTVSKGNIDSIKDGDILINLLEGFTIPSEQLQFLIKLISESPQHNLVWFLYSAQDRNSMAFLLAAKYFSLYNEKQVIDIINLILVSMGNFPISESSFRSNITPKANILTNTHSTKGLIYTQRNGYYGVSLYEGRDTNVIIPSSYNGREVKFISDCAFMGNSIITSVLIPNSVEELGEHVFMNCVQLKSVIIPKTVVEIGIDNFYNCPNLKIFVQYPSIPKSWKRDWNVDDLYDCYHPVIWNYK
jgi:hypothetical protein